MKRKLRLILPLIVASLTLSGCFLDDWFGGGDGTDKKAVMAFYEDYDLELSGDRLAMELQKMCWAKHTKWVSYGQLNTYYAKRGSGDKTYNSVDAVSDGSVRNQLFYTGREKNGYSSGTSKSNDTREHVWPCANSSSLWSHDGKTSKSPTNVDRDEYLGGGSDLLHVRPCNNAVNTARGNSRFVDFDDPEYAGTGNITDYKDYVNGGKYTIKLQGLDDNEEYAKYAEPADEMKGDVARIIVYLWVHYKERGLTPQGQQTSGTITYKYSDMTSANLVFTQIMGYNSDARCREKLIEWNEMDKPSTVEKLRNNTVQKVQGNRNPFVDYPELVRQMLSDED